MKNERKPRAIVFGLGVVFLLGVSSFAMAFKAFPSRLSQPFNLLPAKSLSSISFNQGLTEDLLIDSKDTDKDGIPDIQELQVYGTSPFLPDSDSDGFNDKQEIDNGEDPNCPAGISCASLTLPADQTGPALPDSLDGLTPEQIRSLLLQSGASEEELKAVSDEELKSIYQQAIIQGQSDASTGAGLTELKPSDYEAITPDQLRALLIDQGASQEDLKDLSDADLRQLWNQVLIEAQAQANTNQP